MIEKPGAYGVSWFDPTMEITRRQDWLKARDLASISRELSSYGLASCSRVVDLGCGIGVRTLLTAKYFDQGHVVGVDRHRALITVAEDRARSEGINNVSFVQADVSDTGLETEGFDLVRIDSVLWAVPNPAKVLREALRLLRQGGLLTIYNNDATALQYLHYPPFPTPVAHLHEVMFQALEQLGADQFIGHKLFTYVVQAGFMEAEVMPEVIISSGPQSDQEQAMHWQFIDQWLPEMLLTGLVSTVEVENARREYTEWAGRHDRMSSRLLFRIKAKKPPANLTIERRRD